MRPTDLCTGTKNVLLARYWAQWRRILLSRMGPNCYPFLLEAADIVDIRAYQIFPTTFQITDFKSCGVCYEDLSCVAVSYGDSRAAVASLWATGCGRETYIYS